MKNCVKTLFAAMFLFFILFVAGCGENQEESKVESTIPTEPPSVSQADKDRKPTKGIDGDNFAVSQANLPNFIETFSSSINLNYGNNYSSAKRADKRPNEYQKNTGNSNYTIRDKFGGRVEFVTEYKTTLSQKTTNYYESGTTKYFDYSNSDELFFSGALGHLTKFASVDEDYSIKINGVINFAGKYNGKMVFDNLLFRQTAFWIETTSSIEAYIDIINGRFYVQSDEKDTIVLMPEALELFSSFYFSIPDAGNGNYDYGADNITIKMPDVPNATGGNLTERGGAQVNDDNVAEFFSAFIQEIEYNYGFFRSENEEKTTKEEVKHGVKSGYRKYNEEETRQINSNKEYLSKTEKVEYYDYSNVGVLYFGAGFGSAKFEYKNYNSYGYIRHTYETILNGKLKFNGDFKGELVFDNFKYKYVRENYEDEEYLRVSGSVKIGNFDFTEQYIKHVVEKDKAIITDEYTIILDAQGGSVPYDSFMGTFGSTECDLPIADKEGCFFDGWYEKESETLYGIGECYIITKNVTLYAHWKKCPTEYQSND
ncbi:MAG: InlB B-repeat-containing protein [Chitinivibrionia bacterium]|nr:InlB B-repeat-containing protein [Chitinivibrionia bacterium]